MVLLMPELLKHAMPTSGRKLIPDMPANMNAVAEPEQANCKLQLASAFADELAALREEARSEGYLAGYEAGNSDAAEHFLQKERELLDKHSKQSDELAAVISALSTLKMSLEAAHQQALTKLDSTVLAIAYASVARMLGNAEVFQSALALLVQQAIETFGQQHPMSICMAEADAALMQNCPELQSWLTHIVADKQLERGSCIIECGPRSLDASMLTQLTQLRETLLASSGS